MLEHDLAATRNGLKPKRARLDEIAGEIDVPRSEQIDAADVEITSSAERLSVLASEFAGSAEGRGDPAGSASSSSRTAWRHGATAWAQMRSRLPDEHARASSACRSNR